MKTHRYRLVGLRLVISFLGAFHININGHWDLIPKAVVTPMFYIAFLVSFGVSYLMLYLIHKGNSVLNRKYPWKRNIFIRTILQLTICVVLPGMVDMLFISLHFVISKPGFQFMDFVKYDFLTVVLFIVFVNVIYLIPEFFIKPNSEILSINYNGIHVKLNVTTDVLFFYKDRKLIKVHTLSGKEYSIKGTISEFKKKYEVFHYCQINPSAIANLNVVQGHTPGTARDTLEVLFLIEYESHLKNLNPKMLRVTKDHIETFKSMLQNAQIDKYK